MRACLPKYRSLSLTSEMSMEDLDRLKRRVAELREERLSKCDFSEAVVEVKLCWDKDFWARTILQAALGCQQSRLKVVLNEEPAKPFKDELDRQMSEGVYFRGHNKKDYVVFGADAFAEHADDGEVPLAREWFMMAACLSSYVMIGIVRQACNGVMQIAAVTAKAPHLLEVLVTSDEKVPVRSAPVSRVLMACIGTVKPVARLDLIPGKIPLSPDEIDFVRAATKVFIALQISPREMSPEEMTAVLCWYSLARESPQKYCRSYVEGFFG